MFSLDELTRVLENTQFRSDRNWVKQSLVETRVQRPLTFDPNVVARLAYLVEAVLASAASLDGIQGRLVLNTAAEVAELLGSMNGEDSDLAGNMRFRSAILYELAGKPSISGTVIRRDDLPPVIDQFIRHRGAFGRLGDEGLPAQDSENGDADLGHLAVRLLSLDAARLGQYQQGAELPDHWGTELLRGAASKMTFGITGSELGALTHLLNRRRRLSTRGCVDDSLLQGLREIRFPAELWDVQAAAIDGGLLNEAFDSWGLAAPTGTGKTFLTRALILDMLRKRNDGKVLYLVPSRALVHEVASDLGMSLGKLGYAVLGVGPQLVALAAEERSDLEACSVAVLTPEKADLLLRLGLDLLQSVCLLVVDEAHHIEAGTRGALLELYLWRLRRILGPECRVVFLSAVAPNISQIAAWLGSSPGSVAVDERATRMRAGVFRIRKSGRRREGWIEYSDGTSLQILQETPAQTNRRCIAQLADALLPGGSVLVVAKGKRECEALAAAFAERRTEATTGSGLHQHELEGPLIQRLDSRLEREMYETVPLRALLQKRIVYHHAGLPPRVRSAVEDVIRAGLVDVVFATTTLAEGVNFPFSTVLVQSLALQEPPQKGRPARYHPVTPRAFWNIAGRAGRPGVDKEGQAILFEPSLGLDKVNRVIEPYLNPSLSRIEDVTSALAEGLKEVSATLEAGECRFEDLGSTMLPESLPNRAKGVVNLLRVAIVHARASHVLQSTEEILDGSFAFQFLTGAERTLSQRLLNQQKEVVDAFLQEEGAPAEQLVAELGLSIATLQEMKEYAEGLEEWQLRNMARVMRGGEADLNQARYVVGPVAKRMTELEGGRLGGLYAHVVMSWLGGVPLHVVYGETQSSKTLEDLISVIYSRIQYLMPWGLFAYDRLVETTCRRRGIPYNNEIVSLAFLVDEGVPSFDALRLVHIGFERVDAARLAAHYRRAGGLNAGVDVIGWIAGQDEARIRASVMGTDGRRVDYDLGELLHTVRAAAHG